MKKLVPPDAPYSEGRSNLSPGEHGLSKAAFEIIQAFRLEVSEHDEDPEFDADDVLSAIMKTYGFGRTLAAHFVGNPNIAKDVEAISHGVVRNLGVLDELRATVTPVEPGTQVTEDTPGEPPAPPLPPSEPDAPGPEEEG